MFDEMSRDGNVDFDIAALYQALDAHRETRGLTWTGAAREISRPFERTPAHPISVSTLRGMPSRGAIEADGVLQMLLWLGRTPESFVLGFVDTSGATLPDVGPRRILRFDTKAIYSAVDAQRIETSLRKQSLSRVQ